MNKQTNKQTKGEQLRQGGCTINLTNSANKEGGAADLTTIPENNPFKKQTFTSM